MRSVYGLRKQKAVTYVTHLIFFLKNNVFFVKIKEKGCRHHIAALHPHKNYRMADFLEITLLCKIAKYAIVLVRRIVPFSFKIPLQILCYYPARGAGMRGS